MRGDHLRQIEARRAERAALEAAHAEALLADARRARARMGGLARAQQARLDRVLGFRADGARIRPIPASATR